MIKYKLKKWTMIIESLFFKYLFNFERERERECAGEGQREKGRLRIPSSLHTVSVDVGPKLTNPEIMT